ncbi:MAG: hypothetical protein ACI8RZ_001401 [Myxococcota bacterium]|jgi:hypothetical protein
MLILLSLLACSGSTEDSGTLLPVCDPADYPQDDTLTLSAIQALGTHNSTHIAPETLVDSSHGYTHPPLGEQLERGVRQLELDLHYRDGEGIQVFHLPVLDEVTTCLQFSDCLAEIATFSDANPCHSPLMIWLELKDEDLDTLDDTLLTLTDRYDEIEAAITAGLGADRVITPDEVRGSHATLPQAIAADGWPTLRAARGRVVISLLEGDAHRDAYLTGTPALEGRQLFVRADTPEDAFAATFKEDNAIGHVEEIAALVAAGFLVTSNTDGVDDTDEENTDRFAATLSAGSHYIATDFIDPIEGHDYLPQIPDGTPARCNPVTAATGCVSADIE